MNNIIDRNDPKPLYLQLEELIRGNIEKGIWKVNTKVPSEAELMKEYDLSRITVRNACNHLVKEGVLYRVTGKGTFVANPKIMTTSLAYMGFREQLERMGYKTTTKLLNKEIIKAGINIASHLGIKENDDVIFIKRLRLAEGEPISLHYSYLPYNKFKEIWECDELESKQLCVLIEEKYEIKPNKVLETLESMTSTEDVSAIFETGSGYPLLILEDVMYDAFKKPYEYSKVIFRGDKVKLRYEFL
ncbi:MULTISPECIES: GntR family transcriptional regulator [Anaerofustis]|uniref:GntR family transcriptional regulator n=1 Tax=Anaerofustis TaxID=264995 RepID=UPI0011063258|nr:MULTISPECIES: GntR family transcriptional regulator [Anaerofustis]MCO8192972.1 GntR family transcriptional regulator [Anaerofustis sp. NSJ-163]